VMPFDRSKYPDDWENFSADIRSRRAASQCECVGECGLHGIGLFRKKAKRCEERNGQGAKWAKGKIVLTVAHLNAAGGPCRCAPLCSDAAHVKAMCQRCHLRYDSGRHSESRARKRDGRRLAIQRRNRRHAIVDQGQIGRPEKEI